MKTSSRVIQSIRILALLPLLFVLLLVVLTYLAWSILRQWTGPTDSDWSNKWRE